MASVESQDKALHKSAASILTQDHENPEISATRLLVKCHHCDALLFVHMQYDLLYAPAGSQAHKAQGWGI